MKLFNVKMLIYDEIVDFQVKANDLEDCKSYISMYHNGDIIEVTEIDESIIKDFECFKCGSKKFFIKEKGCHIGLYCEECKSWQKWVSKKKGSI